MRFKVGDELIIVKDNCDGDFGKLYDIFIVASISGPHYVDRNCCIICADHEVELLSIYNSPLAKALR